MRLFKVCAGLGTALLLSVFFVPPAYAHAAYESSDPGNRTTVSSPPSRVTADFTEAVEDNSRLDVYDPCGTQVDNGDSLVAADRITVSMSADKQGTYTVRFSVVSAVDGHPTSGEFTFTSTGGQHCPGSEPEEEERDESSGGGSGAGGSRGAEDRTDNDGSRDTSTNDAGARNNDRSVADTKASSEDRKVASKQNGVAGTGSQSAAGDLGPSAISATGLANIWEGIPIDAFIVAMLVAAAIGAAGGLVYAGIMGPKR